MKRTTAPKISEGRKALIAAAERCHKHFKGKLNGFSNTRLLGMCNPLDRDDLSSNLK